MEQILCQCNHPFNLHGQLGCSIDDCFCSEYNQMTEQQYLHWVTNNDH